MPAPFRSQVLVVEDVPADRQGELGSLVRELA